MQRKQGTAFPRQTCSRFAHTGKHPIFKTFPAILRKNQSIVQQDPEKVIYHSYLAHFPADADVRLHDLAVWNGVSYTLQQPRNIKGHHLEVLAVRDEKL